MKNLLKFGQAMVRRTAQRKHVFKETTEPTVRVSSKPEEIKQFLEVGFEHICEKDGLVFFRKRK